MQCFMKKEDKRLIDVENIVTTSETRCHLSWRTPSNSLWCTFIAIKHISPTFVYIITMYLRPTTYTKTLPKCHFTYIFFLFLLWLCWLLERSQIASCPRQLQTCARLTRGWVASAGCPPPPKSWLRRWVTHKVHRSSLRRLICPTQDHYIFI